MSKALFRICKIFTCNGFILNYYLQVIKILPREMKKREMAHKRMKKKGVHPKVFLRHGSPGCALHH
jgi:hypothetical protein